MVPQRFRQAEVMLQAASSHHPDVMIVDELATAEVRLLEHLCCRSFVRCFWQACTGQMPVAEACGNRPQTCQEQFRIAVL